MKDKIFASCSFALLNLKRHKATANHELISQYLQKVAQALTAKVNKTHGRVGIRIYLDKLSKKDLQNV